MVGCVSLLPRRSWSLPDIRKHNFTLDGLYALYSNYTTRRLPVYVLSKVVRF